MKSPLMDTECFKQLRINGFTVNELNLEFLDLTAKAVTALRIFCVILFHIRKVEATSRNIIRLCVENSHFAYLLNKKWVAHATLHRWRSVGVVTARADLKSFAARGIT